MVPITARRAERWRPAAPAFAGRNGLPRPGGVVRADKIMRVTASTKPGSQPGTPGWPRRATAALLMVARRNKLFTGALAAGAALRLIALIGFPGAL
jgi:hypothetical protein